MQIPSTLTVSWAIAFLCVTGCASYPLATSDFMPTATEYAPQRAQRLPDPRFRTPYGVGEIDRVASMVAKTTGQRVSGNVVVTEATALASIGGPLENGEIRINPRAAATIPPNSWAFIIGHEFAHRTHELGLHGRTNPELEVQADVIGARYAMDAGFDLAAHIAWTLSHTGNRWSPSHGSLHDRAERLGLHYGIPQEAVASRLSRYGAM
jgi:hypothetical protein